MLCVLISPGTLATAVTAPVTPIAAAATNVDSVSSTVVPRKKVIVVKRKALNVSESGGVGDVAGTGKNDASAGVGQLNSVKIDHSTLSATSGSVVCDATKRSIGGEEGRKRPVGGDGGRSDGDRVVLKKPRHVMSDEGTHLANREVEEGVKGKGGDDVNTKRLSNGGVVARSNSAPRRVCGDGDEVKSQLSSENTVGQSVSGSNGDVRKTVRVKRKVVKAGGVRLKQGGPSTNDVMTSPEPVQEKQHLTTKWDKNELANQHVTSPGSVEVVSTERKKSLAEIKAEM